MTVATFGGPHQLDPRIIKTWVTHYCFELPSVLGVGTILFNNAQALIFREHWARAHVENGLKYSNSEEAIVNSGKPCILRAEKGM